MPIKCRRRHSQDQYGLAYRRRGNCRKLPIRTNNNCNSYNYSSFGSSLSPCLNNKALQGRWIKRNKENLYIYIYIYICIYIYIYICICIYTDTRRVFYYFQADVDTFSCANNREKSLRSGLRERKPFSLSFEMFRALLHLSYKLSSTLIYCS